MLTTKDIDWESLKISFPRKNKVNNIGSSFYTDKELTIYDIEFNDNWIAVLGDIHGSAGALEIAVQACKQANIKNLFQVGDFGYLYNYKNNRQNKAFDEILYEAKEDFDFTLHFIDGNHDNHELFHRNNPDKNARKVTQDFDNMRLPSMPLYYPRGNVSEFSFDGGFDSHSNEYLPVIRKFGFLGGARSVNVLPSEEKEREGIDFWYDEEPTDEDVNYLIDTANGEIDILFTHEAATNYYLRKGIKLSSHMEMLTMGTRNRIQYAVNSLNPTLNIHGHWHQLSLGKQTNYDENGEKGITELICLPEEFRYGNLVFMNMDTYDTWIPQGHADVKYSNELKNLKVMG